MSVRLTRSAESGALLVITLWLVTILSVLAVAIGRYLSTEVRLTKFRLARAQAKALARSGVYLAMQQLDRDDDGPEADGHTYDWLGDEWADGAEITVRSDPDDPSAPPHTITMTITDEQRKLNINAVTATQLESLLGSQPLVQEIVDYMDPEITGEHSVADPPYFQKNSSMSTLDELWDIPGMTADAVKTLRQSTSVHYGGNEKPNINTVSPEALITLGFRPSTAEAIAACREQGTVFNDSATIVPTAETCTGAAGLGLDPDEQSRLMSAFGITSEVFRVVSEGMDPELNVRVRVEAVVKRGQCGTNVPSPCIVAWRES